MSEHIIDGDADPFNPWAKYGWTVKEHRKSGKWKFDPAQVELFLSSGQKCGGYTNGNQLRKELANKPVLNANVLDYWLAHPECIPENCKKDGQGNIRYHIFFWGTIYQDCDDGELYVRYLCVCCDSGRWDYGHRGVSDLWLGRDSATMLRKLDNGL